MLCGVERYTYVTTSPARSRESCSSKLHPSLFPFVEFLLKQIVAGTLLPALPDVPEGVNPAGAVLIFLPGYTEIFECLRKILLVG